MAAPDPEDLHEYVSFDDPDEDRTWVFDVTFFLSNYTCIYGAGCQGVLTGPAEHLQQGCCSYGAHFIDDDDLLETGKAAERLTADVWQFKHKARRSGFSKQSKDGTHMTRLVDDACIFLNRPGFAGGVGCALHIGALAAGERPLDWKPNVCWQVPIRLEHSTDENGHLTSRLREWKRRDWGEGGDDFHWWCTESSDAFIGRKPAYEYLRDEIVEMVGEEPYVQMVALLERPKWTPLPHPALRTKR